jgi:hypothetical protein
MGAKPTVLSLSSSKGLQKFNAYQDALGIYLTEDIHEPRLSLCGDHLIDNGWICPITFEDTYVVITSKSGDKYYYSDEVLIAKNEVPYSMGRSVTEWAALDSTYGQY